MNNIDANHNNLRESLASVQHDIWAHWMRYLLSVCERSNDGRYIIPAEMANRWEKQINSVYIDLSEKEKDSDREQADKVLRLLESFEWDYK